MTKDYLVVSKLLDYMDKNFRNQPELDDLARIVNLSPFHLQKVFTRWVGISPKKFIQFATLEYAKKVLDESHSVLDATYESGLSSPGRTHDLFVNIEAVTPGEYRNRGKGLGIFYGIHDSPFGYALIAVTERGLCGLSFHDRKDDKEGLGYLSKKWMNAELHESCIKTKVYFDKIFGNVSIEPGSKIPLVLKGTPFQVKVWEALLRIPAGQLTTYHDIARMIGQNNANRAVGSAIGANPVSYLIPCHRVIQSMGIIGNYRWGPVRKKIIIGWEAAKEYREYADKNR
jgi:AraC family transcriptional regulator, regulatory protein of adaptative response / methylated-DNA-[protein]-cysteine methyltransferase